MRSLARAWKCYRLLSLSWLRVALRVVMCGCCPWPGRPLPLTVPPIRCAPGKHPVPRPLSRVFVWVGDSHTCRAVWYAIPAGREPFTRVAIQRGGSRPLPALPHRVPLGNAPPCIRWPAYGPSVELWEMVCWSVRCRSPRPSCKSWRECNYTRPAWFYPDGTTACHPPASCLKTYKLALLNCNVFYNRFRLSPTLKRSVLPWYRRFWPAAPRPFWEFSSRMTDARYAAVSRQLYERPLPPVDAIWPMVHLMDAIWPMADALAPAAPRGF